MTVEYDFTGCDLTDLRRATPGVDLLDLALGCAAVGSDDSIVVHYPEGTVRVEQRRLRASTAAMMSHQQARRVR